MIFHYIKPLFNFESTSPMSGKQTKVKRVDTSQIDGSGPGGDINWREEALHREKPVHEPGVTLKLSNWLIPKFSPLARGSRLRLLSRKRFRKVQNLLNRLSATRLPSQT